MSQLSEEEEKAILASPPYGTWALLLTMALAFVAGWAAMYSLFLSHGPVN